MKHLLTLILTFIIILGYSQCDNGTNYYPNTAYTPADNAWGSATTYNWAGEIIKVNIVSGDEYEFSTCSGYGGVNASYDTQLTLIDETGLVVDFNDDFTGCTGYTSYIKHTATYTGILYVHLTEYNCVANTTSTEVRIYKTPATTGGGTGGGSNGTVEVGDPGSTLQNGRVPAYGYYDYSWSAAIYTAAELGESAETIEKISWNVANSNSMVLTNQEIWMAHASVETFPDGTMPDVGNGPWSGFTRVFNGDLPFVPGWNEIRLTSPFNFNGVENVLVKVVNNHGSWASSYPEFQYTSKTNSVVYNYNDGSFPSPAGYINSYRPNTRFAMGGSALPIDLISFNGEVLLEMDPIVLLEWTVSSQVNNEYYTIERSKNLSVWSLVDSIPGNGTTNMELRYSLLDDNPFKGVSYYRLKQTDHDGKTETFKPIAITINSEEKIVSKIINLMGQEVPEDYQGIVIEMYTDGTYKKKYKEQ